MLLGRINPWLVNCPWTQRTEITQDGAMLWFPSASDSGNLEAMSVELLHHLLALMEHEKSCKPRWLLHPLMCLWSPCTWAALDHCKETGWRGASDATQLASYSSSQVDQCQMRHVVVCGSEYLTDPKKTLYVCYKYSPKFIIIHKKTGKKLKCTAIISEC